MSKENKAFKYRLYPNAMQEEYFQKTFGCCRKIWNLMLNDKIEHYQKTKKYLSTNPADYKDEYPFLREVDSLALTSEWMNLETAFKNFFRDKRIGFPKFKSKHKDRNSYTTNNLQNNIRIVKGGIRLPKIGEVKAKIHRIAPNSYKLKRATISQEADGSYYVAVLYEYEQEEGFVEVYDKRIIGFDYKSDGLYMDSNGHCCDMPHYFRESQKKLAKEQRKLSKMTKGSNNYNKQKKKVAKLYRHIANQRLDFLHKESTKIANLYELVVVEDLNMKAIANKKMHNGKATLDNGYGIFLNLLEYKLKDRYKYLIKVDKYFPSTQRCSRCKHKQKLDLDQRVYNCPNCGLSIDRDLNAAINIKHEGMNIFLRAS